MDTENNNKKGYTSTVETIFWMVLTAIIVFVVTSFQYNKMALANNVIEYNYSGDFFPKLKNVYGVVEKEFLFDYDMKTLEEGAIRGMLEALEDPYTNYFDLKETEDFLLETEGEYEGVGLYLSIELNTQLPIVISPIKGSPAEEAGILPGDYITEINGKATKGEALEALVSEIKGTSDSSVHIKFLRYTSETEYEEFEKDIVRRKIEINSFEYNIIDNNIAYLKFDSFDEKASGDFIKAFEELEKKYNLKGLIIDVRNNPGGLLTAVEDIVDYLLPTGIITYTVDKNGNKEYLYSDSNHISIPIVALVNENSASASEIMAAAIKDYDNGKVVGTTTYGKGLVQKLKGLGDGTYIKVTISEYFSPKGNKINEIGVEPNFIVEDNEETEADEQLEKAIETIKEMF